MGPRVRLLSGVMFVLLALTGPFIRGPRLSPVWPSGRSAASPHCVFYCCVQSVHKSKKKSQGWDGEGKHEQTERVGACRSWSGSIKGPPSMLLWSERRGWRFRVHSSLFMPWRCVKMTGWGPRRRAGLGRLILSWTTTERGAPLPGAVASAHCWKGIATIRIKTSVRYNRDHNKRKVLTEKTSCSDSFLLLVESHWAIFSITVAGFWASLLDWREAGWHEDLAFHLGHYSKWRRKFLLMSLLGQMEQWGWGWSWELIVL